MLAAACMLVAGGNAASASKSIFVPDDNLERYLIQLGFDSGELDDYIAYSAAQRITRLDLSNMDINHFDGIEAFQNLEYLDLSGIGDDEDAEELSLNLPPFDFSYNNRSLKTLKAVGSKFYSITVSGAPLETVDVSNSRNLTTLRIFGSKIKSINLTGATDLEYIRLEGGQLTSIDLSSQPKLNALWVNSNRLTSLNLAPVPDLTFLDVRNNRIQSIDLSKNLQLRDVRIGNNELTALDLSKNVLLENLNASDNKLKAIDLSRNPSLRILTVSSNRLTSLDVAANAKLESLGLANNKLSKLNVANLARLATLDVAVNRIKSLDVRSNTDLVSVDAAYNPVRRLSLPSDLRSFIYLNISGTKINRLDLRGAAFTAERDGTASYSESILYGAWGITARDSSATLLVDDPEYIRTIMGSDLDDNVELVRK